MEGSRAAQVPEQLGAAKEALEHWLDGTALWDRPSETEAQRLRCALQQRQAQPCDMFSPALRKEFALPSPSLMGDLCQSWLDADGLLDWARWETTACPMDPLQWLQLTALHVHRRWCVGASSLLEEEARVEFAVLDMYGSEAPTRAWHAHMAGSSAAAGALLVSLFEQYVKLSTRAADWTKLRTKAPNRLSLLHLDARFQEQFPPGMRLWFERLLGGPPNLNVRFVLCCLCVPSFSHPKQPTVRNYLWHGFVGDEYQCEYTTLLFVFAVSWVRRMGAQPLSPVLVQMASCDLHRWAQRSHTALPYVAPLREADLLVPNFFVPPGRQRMVAVMARHWASGRETDLWLCCLLPLLEHALRRVWV
jgi:hypothetical protein